jgi:hypothetical protein
MGQGFILRCANKKKGLDQQSKAVTKKGKKNKLLKSPLVPPAGFFVC